jgi:hypothetical protein
MKRIILCLALAFTLNTSTVFANVIYDSGDKTEQVFVKTFPAAQYVKWSTEGEYRKASFILYGKSTQALFTADGELLGTVRNIFYSDLPIKVMLSLKKRFDNAIPFAISEINRIDGTQYKLFIEIAKKRYQVFMLSDGSFSRLQSTVMR